MTDLFVTDPTLTRTKRRANRLEIINPSVGDKMLIYWQEDAVVDADGKVLGSQMAGTIGVNFNVLAPTTYAIPDPVTGQTVTFSGAAIALWLEHDFITRAGELLNPPTP